MKKFALVAITFILSAFSLKAELPEGIYVIKNGQVVVEKVIPFSISKDQASAAVNSFFVTKLNDSNQTLKNSSDDYYVAKILTPQLTHHSMGQWYTMGELTIDVRFKEDRMKVSVSCGNIINKNNQGTNSRNYSPLDAAPLAEKHDSWSTNILKKPAEETFENLVLYMAFIIEDLNNAVQNAKDEDDW